MSETKDFHIGDILSVTTGRLVSPNHIGGVYEILNWMTGDNLYTHQLPRVGNEARPVLLAAHPQLADAQAEADAVTPDNWQHFMTKMVERYGLMLPVPKMSADQHESIDAMSELVEKVHPDRIITVQS
jgi:hypothetical protein